MIANQRLMAARAALHLHEIARPVRNGPLGVKPPSDDLATVIVLPSVVDAGRHIMQSDRSRRANLKHGVLLCGGHRPSYGFTGSASR